VDEALVGVMFHQLAARWRKSLIAEPARRYCIKLIDQTPNNRRRRSSSLPAFGVPTSLRRQCFFPVFKQDNSAKSSCFALYALVAAESVLFHRLYELNVICVSVPCLVVVELSSSRKTKSLHAAVNFSNTEKVMWVDFDEIWGITFYYPLLRQRAARQ